IFTANANGKGVPAALAYHTRDGRYDLVASPARSKACFVHNPIDLHYENDQVFLLLYGTGLRLPGQTIKALLGGEKLTAAYAPVQGFDGLDQINVELPRTLIGRGIVECTLTGDGFPTSSNRVTIEIEPPPNDPNSPK